MRLRSTIVAVCLSFGAMYAAAPVYAQNPPDGRDDRSAVSAHSLMPVSSAESVSRLMSPPKPIPAPFYTQRNLTSSGQPLKATTIDHHLINPWGLTFGPGTLVWVSDNNAGVSTLYAAGGQVVPLIVKIPLPASRKGPSAPTGIVFNGNLSEFDGGIFIFATEDGTIAKWSDGTKAQLEVDNSGSGAIYKGLALGRNASGDLLFATNFHAGTVDVFDRNFMPVSVPGGFVDAAIPSGFAPFGIANINGDLFVSFAMQDADKANDLPGAGLGFVDVFDTNGNLIKHLISQGPLNAPWGMAMAPADFGPLSGDLLVGNFGDGMINAFDPAIGALLGQPQNAKGQPIVTDGLWSLVFGDGSDGRARNTLYFTAGPKKEMQGLFGRIDAHVPAIKKPPTRGTCMGCHA